MDEVVTGSRLVEDQNMGIDLGSFTGSRSDGSSYFEGVRVYTTEIGAFGQGAAGTLPGIGIFVNPNAKNDIDLLRHEFGHVLQARQWGMSFFYGTIVPESLKSANQANSNWKYDHSNSWTEWTANFLSWQYFGQPADWNHSNHPIQPSFWGRGTHPPLKPSQIYMNNIIK